jgi:beta-mannosidase
VYSSDRAAQAASSGLSVFGYVANRFGYAKGWNWVPPDMMYGVDQPERIERLFQLAKRANVNVLRIWGGGGIERERVYELADKYGIMLWQEFPLSSSGDGRVPSEDPGYIQLLQDEARQVIPLKRNHPSLAVWGGGNELHDSTNRPPSPETLPTVLKAIGKEVSVLDPDRPYLPTSPMSRSGVSELEPQEVHGPYFHMGTERQYARYNHGTSLLSSEFGTEGLNNQNVLNATVPAETIQPVSRDNDTWVHRGEWWINTVMLEKTFGKFGEDLPSLQRASQLFQKDGLQYAVESNLRRWPHNSGSLPWQFNEPFPSGFGTNAVDFFARPKPVYFGVARAYAPVTVTARFDRQAWGGHPNFEAEIWAGNTQAEAVGAVSAEIRIVGADGTEILRETRTASLDADDVQAAGRISVPLKQIHQKVFFLDLALKDAEGRVVGTNRYTFSRTKNLQPLRKLEKSRVDMSVSKHGTHWDVTLTNTGAAAAIGVRLQDARELGSKGGPYFSDDDFPLLPGESRVIQVDWSKVAQEDRQLSLDAWNAEQQ